MIADFVRRWFAAALLALAVMAALWHFSWPGLNPDLWEDVAVAAGLRPSEVALAGTWRQALAELFGRLPFAEAVRVLRVLGVVGGGIVTLLVYSILDALLPHVIRGRRYRGIRGGLVVDGVLAGVTLLFVSSEPVWRACQGGAGATLVQLVLALLAIHFTLGFLFRSGIWRVWVAVVLAGVLTGYGNFGFLLFPLLWMATLMKALKNLDNKTNPLANPGVLHLTLSGISLVFLALTVFMMQANYGAYYDFGGVERSDFFLADMAIVVPRQMMATYTSSTHRPKMTPNCSQITEKMKSVCRNGRLPLYGLWVCAPWNRP